MSASTEYRKLAAIMFTDMVGYSALMENNEALALQLLEEHRGLLRSIFSKYKGSEIKTMGDGFLVEFFSALAAVQCGIEIQGAIAKRNSANPSEVNFQVRIGIHAGDVVRRADDVIGDGVNIAARIVPLTGGGGICVSQQVFDQVENRLANSLKRMGQVKLKNISRPLEVYWVGYEGAPTEPPDLVQADNLLQTQKSIAVLPFVSMSSDPENEYLSDGLTEDLIMAFSRLKGLRVPARTSSFAFKGKNEDVRRIGEQLNVTKILEGSVRKAGERVRITAQLINVADGDHLWAQSFDRELQDVFAIQDEITRAIVRELEMQLIGAGDQSITKHGTYNTEAYQLYLQARYHFYKFTGEGFRRCIDCCKKALEIDPNYALAYAALSLSYQTGWYYGFLSFDEKLVAIGPHDLFAEKAVELDPNLAESQTALGIVKCWNLRDWSGGEDCFKRAIELNPNYVTAHEHYALALACMRRTDEAITHARLAVQIDPLSPMINLHMGLAYWILHRYDLLLEQAQRLFELESNFFGTYWLLGWAHWCQEMRDAAIADLRRAVTLGGGPIQLADLGCLLGRLGRKAEAQQVLEELNEMGRRTYVQPAYIGFVHASLGNHDEAFACFAQGIEHENASVAVVREYCICAGLDDLLADPRLPPLLKQIGLEESSRDEATGLGVAETVVKKKQPSNSATEISESPQKCPRCGAVTRTDERTCINCLLHEGLETKGEASRETFESILTEANVTDTPWRLGHYEILEEIGRGGMGVIYRARQRHSRRIVAVKRVLAHHVDSHETLVRFRREAEAVASLDHPNILPIYEVSESEEGVPFFSMKYATGGSLRAAAPTLRENPRKCVRVMAKAARAIAYAHGKRVLHRDLQPGNILLDENGEPMVSDFGLAKWLNETSDLTRTLETLGTPGYIAPEQAECRAADLTGAADIYSLGAILFYLLAGRPPFVGPNVLFVIHQAAATPAPRLRSLAPSLDRDLETIVARCLESDPSARYKSAVALAEDLEHWLRHEPIRARRVGVFTRGRKWVRRNPTTTVLVAALVVLAAAIVGVTFWKSESIHPVSPMPAGVAVLPFENLSDDKEHTFFADGVQDDILIKLAKIADLKVISRTSVMQYRGKQNVREIGNALRVSHVLEGTVRRSGGKVHVNAQLVDARTDVGVWAEAYDRDLNDVFAIETEVAQSIANRLRAKLSAREKAAIQEWPTRDIVAYDRYVQAASLIDNARYAPNQEPDRNFFRAIELLNEAIARDPNFLLAYCRLAEAHDELYFGSADRTPGRLALAQSAIDTAFRVRSDSSEAHLALAAHLYHGYFDYDRARDELAIAVRTLPNDARIFEWSGYVDRRQGRWHDAVRNFERAMELDPRNVRILTDAANTYGPMRNHGQAREIVDRVIALEPNQVAHRGRRAWIDFEERADIRPMRAVLEQALAEQPASPEYLHERLYLALLERDPVGADNALAALSENTFGARNVGGMLFSRAVLAGLVARMKRDAAAAQAAFSAARMQQEQAVRARPDYGPPLCVLGLIDAALGRKEEALREGRRALELAPIAKDSLDGADVLYFYAVICAWIGEYDLAIKQLETLAKIPAGPSYGDLRLNPVWDPLRGDPRFEKLVEEVKKPVAIR